jgi:hypothetical protein
MFKIKGKLLHQILVALSCIRKEYPEVAHLCDGLQHDVITRNYDMIEISAVNFLVDFFSTYTYDYCRMYNIPEETCREIDKAAKEIVGFLQEEGTDFFNS